MQKGEEDDAVAEVDIVDAYVSSGTWKTCGSAFGRLSRTAATPCAHRYGTALGSFRSNHLPPVFPSLQTQLAAYAASIVPKGCHHGKFVWVNSVRDVPSDCCF